MKAKVFGSDGKPKGEMELPSEVFGANINESLMHLVVTSYRANRRQGTSKTKGRGEVSGGGRKPFRQKGTGRARAGSNTSPLWVRGGKAFGAIPRDYGGTIPKKMRQSALRSALTSRARDENVLVVEHMAYEKPKTKSISALLSELSVLDKRNLLVIGEQNRNVFLSGRNIKNVDIKQASDVNAYDVLSNENVIFCASELVDKMKEVVVS